MLKFNFEKLYKKIVICVFFACLFFCLSSCVNSVSQDAIEPASVEVATEEITIAFEELPSEVQESIMYSPDKGFEKVGTREKKDVFCFAGDIILAEKPRIAYDKGGIDAIVDKGIRLLFNNSDFNVANLECCITDEAVDKADKEWTFALPTKYIKVIKEAGIQLLTLANNHIYRCFCSDT